MPGSNKKWTIILVCAALITLVASLPASAGEKILDFGSLIILHPDSTITVEETLRVVAEGRDISHGIYRNAPASPYLDMDFGLMRYLHMKPFEIYHVPAFNVLAVERDGRPEPFRVKNGVLFIGNEDIELEKGEHAYKVRFETDRFVGFGNTFEDVFRWRVEGYNPGYYKSFPIERTTLTVRLPGGAAPKKVFMEGYSNPDRTDRDFTTYEEESIPRSGDVVSFVSFPVGTKTYGPEIFIDIPKGVIHEPDVWTKLGYLYRDTRHIIIGLVIFVCELSVPFIYYLIAWSIVGRDPKRGIVVPVYTPPGGLSPGSVRYISKKGYDIKCLSAAITDLAAKGWLRIWEKDGRYFLSRTKESASGLPEEESGLFQNLFGSSGGLDVSQVNRDVINGSVLGLKASLRRNNEGKYFRTNARYLLPGIIISLLVVGFEGFVVEDGRGLVGILGVLFYMVVWGPFALMFVRPAFYFGKYFINKKKGRLPYFLMFAVIAPLLLLFALPFAYGIAAIMGTIHVRLTSLVVSITAMHVVFRRLLKKPTSAGKEMLDRIEGFRIFLSATEKDRMNMLNPPDRTPEVFVKYMPYALALDVEQKWSEQFSDIMSAEALAATQGPDPYFLYSLKTAISEILSDLRNFHRLD